jgi:hypothetical protein
MGSGRHDRDDFRCSFEAHTAAVRATCKSVARELRGLPQDQAEQRLTEALRQRGLFTPPRELRILAWQMTDPWRGLKHPFRTRREVRRIFNEPDPDSEPALAESDDVSERISRILDALDPDDLASWEFSAESTFDGPRYELALRPYSDHVAGQIHDALAPIRITIIPGDDP